MAQIDNEAGAAVSGKVPDIMSAFMSRVATRGERAVARIRLVLCVLGFLRLLAFGGTPGLLNGEPKYWIVTLGLWFGAGASIWLLWRLKRHQAQKVDLLFSVALDTLVLGLTLLPGVIWPSDDNIGVLRNPDMAVLLLAVIAGGARLSRDVALCSAGLNIALVAALVALDLNLNASLIGYDGDEFAIWVAWFTGAAGLGVTIATRTRALVLESAAATQHSERVRQRLGAYLSETLAIKVLEEPEGVLGGSRQQVAVLFSDLRGFTRYSERLEPESLVRELNDYFNAMVEAIRDHGGIVDKYIGDGIMVVFGVTEQNEDDALRALRCAEAMMKALGVYNRTRVEKGLAPLTHGIGVHYGPAVAGNIGTLDRLQFTVLGDTVNLASRLESATKTAGVPVLASAEAISAAERASGHGPLPPFESMGAISVRGRDEPVEVFKLTLE